MGIALQYAQPRHKLANATGKIGKEKLVEKVKEMRDSGWYVSAEDYLKIIDYLKNL